MDIGLVGLGKMGGNMPPACATGITVVGYDRNPDVADVASLGQMVEKLPRRGSCRSWYQPVTSPGRRSTELLELLDEGDVIVDGGNSRWTDDQKHAALAAEKNIGYVDCGVSGGSGVSRTATP